MKSHPLELLIMSIHSDLWKEILWSKFYLISIFFFFFKFSSLYSLDALQHIPRTEYITFKFISKTFKITLSSAHRSLKPCFARVQKAQSPQWPSSVTKPTNLFDVNLDGHLRLMKESSLLIKSERKRTTRHHWRHFTFWIFHKTGTLVAVETLSSFRLRANVYLEHSSTV